ncbi:hypothetical protein C7B65_00545 [Phormidesmis priestleyi ULC007]|uniref:DUF5615 domain-containing protein n=1 Tax=Phormidesmis priestleyi ULC007 TaxID=1920490 RepID=A0A2T1DNB3_9CYAN|nr:DUF5615 family PIN-like protein [Phormidesmis priestleyi]PSB21945.1 hypothetical protein C7B65_00545 [Phormidesmis priestleyi ULC007]PZO55086.1 MAG: hypothetical protein DCF14_01030 [Phormidesmis priestleyi]
MVRLYCDEQFPREVSEQLQTMGHDVLTIQAAGNANLGTSDEAVLEFAVANDRTVLTLNRYDFVRLHRLQPDHAGIIVCTNDSDRNRLARRIHEAICTEASLSKKLIRVIRPSTS